MTFYYSTVYSVSEATSDTWFLASTAMVFFMQAGFALLESGTVREKNAQGILMKNMFDACCGCMAFWLIGYGIGFGNPDYPETNNGFLGTDKRYYAGAYF